MTYSTKLKKRILHKKENNNKNNNNNNNNNKMQLKDQILVVPTQREL